MDTLGLYVEDKTEIDLKSRVQSRDLYKAYMDWSLRAGFTPMNETKFGRKMGERFKHVVGVSKFKTGGSMIWQGLRLKK